MSTLFAPVCSITKTKRGRFFWAAWWTGAPTHVPFRKPDASDGAAKTREEALAAAAARAGATLVEIDPLWAKAWMRILRGQDPWPGKASREPRSARAGAAASSASPSSTNNPSIWAVLDVAPSATPSELKAAYRKKALETHPDHGGDAIAFQRVVAAYGEAKRRLKKRGR